jgi:hypothetical protein
VQEIAGREAQQEIGADPFGQAFAVRGIDDNFIDGGGVQVGFEYKPGQAVAIIWQ